VEGGRGIPAEGDVIDPTRALVVSVGIERYGAGVDAAPGAASDATRFAWWAIRCGVPPERIVLARSWSALTVPDREPLLPAGVRLLGTGHQTLRTALIGLGGVSADLLLLYWCGHGKALQTHERVLFTSDASPTDLHALGVGNILHRLASTAVAGSGRQIVLIDACADFGCPFDAAFADRAQ